MLRLGITKHRPGAAAQHQACRVQRLRPEGVVAECGLKIGADGSCAQCSPTAIAERPEIAEAMGVAAVPAAPAWHPLPWMRTSNFQHLTSKASFDEFMNTGDYLTAFYTWRVDEVTTRQHNPTGALATRFFCFAGRNCEHWSKPAADQPDKTPCLTCNKTYCESYQVNTFLLTDEGERIPDANDALGFKTQLQDFSCWDNKVTLESPIYQGLHTCAECTAENKGHLLAPWAFPDPAATQRQREAKEILEAQVLQQQLQSIGLSQPHSASAAGSPAPTAAASYNRVPTGKPDFKIPSRGAWYMNEIGVGSKQVWELVSRTTPFELCKLQKQRLELARKAKDQDEFDEVPAEPENFFKNQGDQVTYFSDVSEREDLPPILRARALCNSKNIATMLVHARELATTKTFDMVYKYCLEFRARCRQDCAKEPRLWSATFEPDIWSTVREEALEAKSDAMFESIKMAKLQNGGRRNRGDSDGGSGGGNNNRGDGGGDGDRKKAKQKSKATSAADKSELRKKQCRNCGRKGHVQEECRDGNAGKADRRADKKRKWSADAADKFLADMEGAESPQ
jgi:hypothetical protein